MSVYTQPTVNSITHNERGLILFLVVPGCSLRKTDVFVLEYGTGYLKGVTCL